MFRKIINLILLILVAVITRYFDFLVPQIDFNKIFHSILWLTILYIVISMLLNEVVRKRLKDQKIRYSFKKIANIIFIFIYLIIILRIWVINPQTLLVSYGIIAAGAAIALQDIFKSFAGGLLILFNGLYKVGDRIQIDNKFGDVIDIGILYTTIFENNEWIDGDQPTGRITKIPNNIIISTNINNYTKDHNFIWDEISIPITYESNWQKAIKGILRITKAETKDVLIKAEKEFKKLKEKYYVKDKVFEPAVYVKLTDNWITLNLRYITDTRSRRELSNKINNKILKYVDKENDIVIASSTSAIDIVSFPEIKIKKK